ncbi:MAG: hypothetical protein M3Q65_14810 [Chloroflexota bacterium]|nr:hypothetical protein [Chloroflexota bacterium]
MMSQQEQKAIQLSVVQVVAGALASVSAAVVASTFGLAGTLLGAAITSVIATVGSALYTHSLERARARIPRPRDGRAGKLGNEVVRLPARRPIAWIAVLSGAALVFVLAMGAITALEVAAHRPVASLVGQNAPEHAQTTVGGLLHTVAESAPDAPATDPASEDTVPVTPESRPTTGVPGQAPASTATADATATPPKQAPRTAPTPTAPAAPTEEAPVAPTAAPGGPGRAPGATPQR